MPRGKSKGKMGHIAKSMNANLKSGTKGPTSRGPLPPKGKAALPPSASKKPNQRPFPQRGYA